MSDIVKGAVPMAKGYALLKREFLNKKNKADDERITVRIDQDDSWLWGTLSLANGDRGVSLNFSGSNTEEIDAALVKMESLMDILGSFQEKLKDQADKIKKNLAE